MEEGMRFSQMDLASAQKALGPRFQTSAGIYGSPAWWLAVEYMRPEVDARYFVASSAEENCAALPAYFYNPGRCGDPYSCDWLVGTDIWPGNAATAPWVIAGGCSGLYGGIAFSGHETVIDAGAALLPLAIERSSAEGFNLFLPYMSADLRTTICDALALPPHAVPLYGVHAVLTLDARNFGEYVSTLPYQFRAVIKRDLKRIEASQLSIRQNKLSETLCYFPRLWDTVEQFHGAAPNLSLRAEMLAAQAAALDDTSRVFTAIDAATGEPIAASLNYRFRDGLYCRLIGMDYERARATGAYFQTMFYSTIEHALKMGLKKIYLGTDALQAKIFRGAHLEPLYTFFMSSEGSYITQEVSECISKTVKKSACDQLVNVSSKSFQSPDFLL